ncbi:MAG: hypothetical protein ACI89U_002372 [Gammaproteobacteria bacterium]|jgi:hypothetical protein
MVELSTNEPVANGARTLMDPTAERAAATRERTKRPEGLVGLRIGLLDISKPRGDVFMTHLGKRIRERGMEVVEFVKPTFTRVAPVELVAQMAASVDVVIEGLAD